MKLITRASSALTAMATAWKAYNPGANPLSDEKGKRIRANRLAQKEAVKAAVDQAALKTIMTQWTGFVAYMRGQLGA